MVDLIYHKRLMMYDLAIALVLDAARERALARRCRRLHHHACPAVAAYSADAAVKAGLVKEVMMHD